MKKSFLVVLLSLMSSVLLAYGQIVNMTVIGKGGTTTGDKIAACSKAQSRANIDITSNCMAQNGKLIDLNFSSCKCLKKPGSMDDYNCDVTAYGKCQLMSTHHYEQFIGTGIMNTYYGDTARACFFAQDRALREAQNRCAWVYGQPVSHQFSPCHCSKIPGPNYEYSCRVDAYLQCRVQ